MHTQVPSADAVLVMDKAVDPFGQMMFSAVELKVSYQIVQVDQQDTMTVVMVKMLELHVQQVNQLSKIELDYCIQFIIMKCDYWTVCTDGDIRLSGGRNATEGRVEICSSGSWGTVCDDFWSAIDAQVVCNQLDFANTGLYQSRYSKINTHGNAISY